MAFGRLARRPRPAPMSDINMTPLIDVMLVLLVIFIIAAPLMASRLRLDLPRAAGAAPADAPAALLLALDAEGRVYLGTEAVEWPAVSERVRALARSRPDTEVHLRADARVPYGRVAELMGLVQEAGLTRIGLVVEPRGTPPAR